MAVAGKPCFFANSGQESAPADLLPYHGGKISYDGEGRCEDEVKRDARPGRNRPETKRVRNLIHEALVVNAAQSG